MSRIRLLLAAVALIAAWFATTGSSRAADDREPVPMPLALAKAESVVKDVFKAEYAKTKLADRIAFANKLLTQAEESKEDPAAHYVMLREARDLALKAGDATTALKAATELTDSFRIPQGEAYTAIADSLVAASTVPSSLKNVADGLQLAAETLVVAGDWDAALKLLASADAAARKGNLLAQSTALRARSKQVESIKLEAAKIDTHRFNLRDNADDPVANTAVGRFHCFITREWDKGLPLLAKSGDAKLQAAAAQDLKASQGTDADRLAAADTWYDLIEAADPSIKLAIQARAYFCYSNALPQLTGLNKIKAETRIKELQPAAEVGVAKGAIWPEIRRAIAGKKLKRWDTIGGAFTQDVFEEIPPAGAILIGFRYTTTGTLPSVIQPIFLTEKGEVNGRIYGVANRGMVQVTKAKPGYAVGAIYTRGGGGIDAFRPIYMKIAGKGLNPADVYDGPYVGGKGGGEAVFGGDGNFIVGIHGKARTGKLGALSIVTLTTATNVPKGKAP